MAYYAAGCASLESLDAPDLTSFKNLNDCSSFMYHYSADNRNLLTLGVPDTSNITAVGSAFMKSYASGCSSLTSLEAPNLANTVVNGNSFLESYANGCYNLQTLGAPSFAAVTGNTNCFLRNYASGCANLTELGISDTQINEVDPYFMENYAYNCTNLQTLGLPNIAKNACLNNYNESVPFNNETVPFNNYAFGCNNLTLLKTKSHYKFFTDNSISFGVHPDRLGYLQIEVPNKFKAGWDALTVFNAFDNSFYVPGYWQSTLIGSDPDDLNDWEDTWVDGYTNDGTNVPVWIDGHYGKVY
ncbi:hypothetical protein, partial [Treponema sp. R6D11]